MQGTQPSVSSQKLLSLDFCKYLLEEPTGYYELIDYDLEDVTPYRSQFDIISDLH